VVLLAYESVRAVEASRESDEIFGMSVATEKYSILGQK